MNEQQQPAPLSEEQLQLIRERVERIATPGPYHVGFANDAEIGDHWYVSNNEMPYHATLAEVYEEGDAQFFLHSLTDVPALLAEVERLRADVVAWRADFHALRDEFNRQKEENGAMHEFVSELAAEVPSHRTAFHLHERARAILVYQPEEVSGDE